MLHFVPQSNLFSIGRIWHCKKENDTIDGLLRLIWEENRAHEEAAPAQKPRKRDTDACKRICAHKRNSGERRSDFSSNSNKNDRDEEMQRMKQEKDEDYYVRVIFDASIFEL